MRILGIETSCDETAFALAIGEGETVRIERSLVSSQADLHAKYGGVVPEVAARAHVEMLIPLMKELGIDPSGKDIDAIAVTAGPGLLPSLRIGVEFAKALAFAWEKPLIPVNHLEGHIYSTWFQNPPSFPALALLVSGGHTEIVLMKDHGDYDLIGMTRDDAAGEAFDKVAKLLGLGYPGGPEISRLAKESVDPVPFPRPMIASGDYDFSFSGLKTAVSVFSNEHPDTKPEDVAAGFQEAVIDVLATKLMKAVDEYGPSSVLLTGGVSANTGLREEIARRLGEQAVFHAPELSLTGDNAAMIAAAGYFRAKSGESVQPSKLKPNPNLRLA